MNQSIQGKVFKRWKTHFWGGLTLAAENEGVGLFDQELAAFLSLGGKIFMKVLSQVVGKRKQSYGYLCWG